MFTEITEALPCLVDFGHKINPKQLTRTLVSAADNIVKPRAHSPFLNLRGAMFHGDLDMGLTLRPSVF
jgi:hypothetical protein